MIVKFNNQQIYISSKSFKQNNKIEKELRFDVNEQLLNNNIVSIGGEGYIFGLTNNNIKKIINYTNSKYIYDDANLNNKYYKKELENNLVNYNNIKSLKSGKCLIINLAKLNINLLNLINKRYYTKIIIINCHHDEFWKRIKLLTNYKLILRKQYITDSYFVTINVLNYKKQIPIFIPLGNNCAIAYQLNKLNLRYNSYPFDWAHINIKKINNVLQNNFEDFSALYIYKYSNNHLDLVNNNIGTYIIKNKYNIKFAHELLNKYDLNLLENIFNKRIVKFKECKNKNIIFILLNLEKNIDKEINILVNNLLNYFHNFKILYISNYEIKPNKYIIWHKINSDWSTWELNHLDWENIIFN